MNASDKYLGGGSFGPSLVMNPAFSSFAIISNHFERKCCGAALHLVDLLTCGLGSTGSSKSLRGHVIGSKSVYIDLSRLFWNTLAYLWRIDLVRLSSFFVFHPGIMVTSESFSNRESGITCWYPLLSFLSLLFPSSTVRSSGSGASLISSACATLSSSVLSLTSSSLSVNSSVAVGSTFGHMGSSNPSSVRVFLPRSISCGSPGRMMAFTFLLGLLDLFLVFNQRNVYPAAGTVLPSPSWHIVVLASSVYLWTSSPIFSASSPLITAWVQPVSATARISSPGPYICQCLLLAVFLVLAHTRVSRVGSLARLSRHLLVLSPSSSNCTMKHATSLALFAFPDVDPPDGLLRIGVPDRLFGCCGGSVCSSPADSESYSVA